MTLTALSSTPYSPWTGSGLEKNEAKSAKVPFNETLETYVANPPTGPAWDTRYAAPSAPRQDPAAVRQGSAADALGLTPVSGAVATIDSVVFYGTADGWTTDRPAQLGPTPRATGEEMLGFTPEWAAEVTSGVVDVNAQPAGVVQLNTKYYATDATAVKLGDLLGATPVAAEASSGGPPVSGGTQWELEFPNGIRLNAGLVADMFMRDPGNAIARMRAELGI